MGETDMQTFDSICQLKYDFEDETFDSVSAESKDFIRKLLLKNGNERMTAKDALSHPWLIESFALDTELLATKTKLKRYVIKKRWIKAVNLIIALHRMGAKIDFALVWESPLSAPPQVLGFYAPPHVVCEWIYQPICWAFKSITIIVVCYQSR